MALELMPGWEPVQPRAAYQPPPSQSGYTALAGCRCAACQNERAVQSASKDDTAKVSIAQILPGNTVKVTPPAPPQPTVEWL